MLISASSRATLLDGRRTRRNGRGARTRDRDEELATLRARIDELESASCWRLTGLEALDAGRRLSELEDAAHATRALREVLATSAWVSQLPPQPLKVSVLLATRDRAASLPRAIGSVLAQRHEDWELIIADDASEDETPDVLAALDDPRITCLRAEGRGQSAALNIAARHATGEVIAYLDDDNVMLPDWLLAVAYMFLEHPDRSFGYGPRVRNRDARWEDGGAPTLVFEPWRRATLELWPIAETNSFVHRRRAWAPLDESLATGSDWKRIWQVTGSEDPMPIPVPAILYTYKGDNRMSAADGALGAARRLQRERLDGRPMRVLSLVDGELPAASAPDGVVVSRATPWDLIRQVRSVEPDLIVLPADAVTWLLGVLWWLRVPFVTPEPVPALADEPAYLGVWSGRASIAEGVHDWRARIAGHVDQS